MVFGVKERHTWEWGTETDNQFRSINAECTHVAHKI